MTRRYVCLHGHFYQPPRENPWLEYVEVQDSAAPFHDWNERISAECYAPNGAARVKTAGDRICDIVNNYDHLSFNFGPTLLSWLERARPDAYEQILRADADSLRRRGHGNAIAQAYSHPILPLCSPRDRRTQVLWGIADFRHRFRREPEGFWLPELAVDTETLRTVAREGGRFVILSPYQAKRVRAPGRDWLDASHARFDPTRPYRVHLGEGLSIVVFFYDGPIARAFAFDGALSSTDSLLHQLRSGFDSGRGHDEVLTVAIDGETFGHHKKGADEVLAMSLRALQARGEPELVNLGQMLELMPVEWEAEVIEGSSWSCSHGLERWRGDCGCQSSGQPGWRQLWRAPLREALDSLRGHLADIFEREGGRLFRDPWQVRDEYIELVLDPERRQAREFVARRVDHPLDAGETEQALKLLELQRHALLMYTSCGWFFSEVSGLETVQIIKYAARAIQLAREVAQVDLEPIFVDGLSRAPSNIEHFRDGARVYELCVRPSVVSLEGVAAHYAIASLFKADAPEGRLFCYRYAVHRDRKESLGPATLAVGRLELESLVTTESLDTDYCVLHLGGSDFRCGLRPFANAPQHSEMDGVLFARLSQASLAQVMREIDRLFVGRDYTLRDLFLDERRRMAHLLLRDVMRRYENDYLQIFESNRRLMEFLREIDSPIPVALRVAADVAIGQRLLQLMTSLEDGRIDRAVAHGELLGLVDLARRLGANPDLEPLRPIFDGMIRERMTKIGQPSQADWAFELTELIDLGQKLGLPLDLASAQNHLWSLVREPGHTLDRDRLVRLGQKLWFDAPTLEARANEGAAKGALVRASA